MFFQDTEAIWLDFIGKYAVFFIFFMILTPFFKLAGLALHRCFLPEYSSEMTQHEMNQLACSYTFNFDQDLSDLVFLISFTLLFASGVPVLLPLLFLNLIIRYGVNICILMKYSSR
jgi:hypothetical protein